MGEWRSVERTDYDRAGVRSQWSPDDASETVSLGSLGKAGRPGGRWDEMGFLSMCPCAHNRVLGGLPLSAWYPMTQGPY